MTEKDYSKTPLTKKLGIKEGAKVALVNKPDGFEMTLGPLPTGTKLYGRATEPLDVIVFFAESRRHLGRRLSVLAGYLADSGGLWVAYPKKSSGVDSDLSFESVQQAGLDLGLVDNKSCAVNDVWTAVRFVYRLEDRRR